MSVLLLKYLSINVSILTLYFFISKAKLKKINHNLNILFIFISITLQQITLLINGTLSVPFWHVIFFCIILMELFYLAKLGYWELIYTNIFFTVISLLYIGSCIYSEEKSFYLILDCIYILLLIKFLFVLIHLIKSNQFFLRPKKIADVYFLTFSIVGWIYLFLF